MCFALAFTLVFLYTHRIYSYKWFRGSIVRSETHLAFGGSRAYCFDSIVVVDCAHTTEKYDVICRRVWSHVHFVGKFI